MKTLIALLILSQLSSADYVNNGDGTITNEITQTIWQDQSHTIDTQDTWNSAINYCEALVIGTNSNWRLPTINELISFIDYTNYNPTINDAFQYKSSADGYWSSTTAQTKTEAWFVDFEEGDTGSVDKASSLYIRCVSN